MSAEQRASLEWINEHAAAKILSCSLSKLRQDRHKHQGIPYIKMGRSVRYSTEDIRMFMAAHRIDPAA